MRKLKGEKSSVFFLFFSITLISSIFGANNHVGTLKWKCNVGPIFSSPAVAKNGTIYVGNLEGYLCAASSNGTLKWKYKTQKAIFSSPAIGEDGTVYVGGTDGYLYAINPNGTLKWKYKVGFGDVRDLIKSSVALDKNGTIYVGDTLGYLYAVNPNGTLKWSFNTYAPIVFSSPAIGRNGVIYVGNNGGYLYAVNPNGTLKWIFDTHSPITFSSPAIGKDGTIYVGNNDGYLYAVNLSGTLKWKYKLGSFKMLSPCIALGVLELSQEYVNLAESVYVAGGDYLYALGTSGILEWKYKIKFPNLYFESSPMIAGKDKWDHTIFVGGDYFLFALTSYGKLKWYYNTEGVTYSSPTIGKDGTIYVGSLSGYLYAINSSNKELANSAWPKFRHDNFNSGNALMK